MDAVAIGHVYWLAVHQDRAQLAELIGTSLAMIKTHYKRAIPREVAEEFWKLIPSPPEAPGKIIPISTLDSMDEFPALKFRFAKTMPETPHFYVVRSAQNNAEYERLFNLIAEQGVWEEWKDGRQYRYLYREGWKYWSMSPEDITQSKVINLAKA